ncbi:efflux RND transporter periplasmic adaptor subunit, partial [Micromonosporaceae bacterium Da 78-11]
MSHSPSSLPPRPLVLTAAALLTLSLTAASCDDDGPDVSLGAATRGTVAEIVEAPGSVTARAAATISTPAAGTLTDLRVDAGDRVSKGQIIGVVDAPELKARRRSAEKALDQASSGGAPAGGTAGFTAARRRTDNQAADSFADARAAAAKITDPALRTVLLQQIAAAQQQYTAASTAAAASLRSVELGVASLGQAVGALAEAQKIQARQAYQVADAAVDALTLRAPVAGVVQLGGVASAGATSSLTDLLAGGGASSALAGGAASGTTSGAGLPGVDPAIPQGGYVAAGTPVVTIVDTSRLGLTAEVDETDVLLVKPGGAATVELDAATGATYQAKVRAVDLLPTTSARGGVSYRVRLDLGAGTGADETVAPTPRPGMSAVVRLQVRQATDAVTVPASAVVAADGHDTVWAIRDGRYRRIPVTLGVQGEDVVQITTGIDPGERVIIAGADQVQPGDKA